MTRLRSLSFVEASAAEERVEAVADFGFTGRQARFLVTVMQHSGVCLQRQYAAFAGIVEGQKTRNFFAKLVKRGYATAHRCRHNRAQVYHVRHKPLYRAIGEPDSRHRRPLSAARVVDGLMLLDALLGTPGVMWLGTRDEKRDALWKLVGVSSENAQDSGHDARALMVVRAVHHSTPIGLDDSGRPVFIHLVRSSELDDFRRFLQRHATLCHALPAWTLRVVAPPVVRPLIPFFQRIVEGEFARPTRATIIEHLRWYFAQRRATALDGRRHPQRGGVRQRGRSLQRPLVQAALSALADRGRRPPRRRVIACDRGRHPTRNWPCGLRRSATPVSSPLTAPQRARSRDAGG